MEEEQLTEDECGDELKNRVRILTHLTWDEDDIDCSDACYTDEEKAEHRKTI